MVKSVVHPRLYFSILLLCLVRVHGEGIQMDGGGTTMQFEGSEHRAAADTGFITTLDIGAVNSSFTIVPTNVSTAAYNFTNAKGTPLFTYGDIVAFSGDFFGPENELSIVCSGGSDEEARALFFASFSKLWNTRDSSYINRIRAELQKELDAVAANSGKFAYTAFAKLPEARWTNVFVSTLEMSLLLTSNLDHFSSCAIYTYTVGHQLALETASKAADMFAECTNSSVSQPIPCLASVIQTFDLAYAINAFADHFLTDLFASGHIRTPRRFLTTTCMAAHGYVSSFLGTLSSGGLASQWMHDEDNRNGLTVTNKRGDVWVAFGDDNYFDGRNARNRALVQEAAQISRNEVFAAFAGQRTDDDIFVALTLIPDTSKLSQFAANNTCPLFYSDSTSYGSIYVRERGQIRPDVWRVPKGFPGDPNQITCNYTLFTYNECPRAVLSKAEGHYLPTWLNKAYSQKLMKSDEDEAWITERPDPAASSAVPFLLFGISGLIIGFVVAVCFLAVRLIAIGKVMEKLHWLLKSSLIPSALIELVFLAMFLAVYFMLPDIWSLITSVVWLTYSIVGVAIILIFNSICHCVAEKLKNTKGTQVQ